METCKKSEQSHHSVHSSEAHIIKSLLLSSCPSLAAEVTGVDVYTWGSNANTTLGHAHSRPHPERLELPAHLSISQVRVAPSALT